MKRIAIVLIALMLVVAAVFIYNHVTGGKITNHRPRKEIKAESKQEKPEKKDSKKGADKKGKD
jgi:uncharacterized protein YxeA